MKRRLPREASRPLAVSHPPLIRIVDEGQEWYTHRSRLAIYSRGLRARAESIAASYLLAEVDFQAGDLVVDCGANMGDLYLYFALNGPDVHFIGFEPSHEDFECLNRNVKTPSKARNEALRNKSAEAQKG